MTANRTRQNGKLDGLPDWLKQMLRKYILSTLNVRRSSFVPRIFHDTPQEEIGRRKIGRTRLPLNLSSSQSSAVEKIIQPGASLNTEMGWRSIMLEPRDLQAWPTGNSRIKFFIQHLNLTLTRYNVLKKERSDEPFRRNVTPNANSRGNPFGIEKDVRIFFWIITVLWPKRIRIHRGDNCLPAF